MVSLAQPRFNTAITVGNCRAIFSEYFLFLLLSDHLILLLIVLLFITYFFNIFQKTISFF